MSEIHLKHNMWSLGAFIHSDLDDLGLDPYEFRVYCHLCRRAGDSGRVWAGQAKIAEVCKMSRKKVNEVIQSLEKHGLVRREARFREDGSQTTSNIFMLGLPIKPPYAKVGV